MKIKTILLIILLLVCLGCNRELLVWEKSFKVEIPGAPACLNDDIYFSNKVGQVVCLNATGDLLWSKNLKATIFSSLAVDDDGTVYVTSSAAKLHCLGKNGNQLWELKLDHVSASTPLILENHVFVADREGMVYKIDKGSKNLLWKKNIGYPVFSSPVFNRDKTKLIIPTKDYYLVSMDLNGDVDWKYRTKGVIFSSPAISSQDDIYLTSMDHHIYKISSSGKFLWKYKCSYWVKSSPAIDEEGNVYFGSFDKFFYCVDRRGKLKWKFEGRARFNASPVLDANGHVYSGDNSGIIYAFNDSGDLLWQFKTPAAVRGGLTILSSRKSLIVGGANGTIYAFSIGSGLSSSAQWPKLLGNVKNQGFTGI